MRYLIFAAAFVASACTITRDVSLDAYPDTRSSLREERAREAVGRMQDEFNALNGGAN